MKKNILIVFLIFSLNGFSQNTYNAALTTDVSPVPIVDYKSRGYIGGISLDSVDAEYGQFDRRGIDYIAFQYGQKWQNRKELLVTDSVGNPLIFPTNNQAFEFNFFYFNGWQLFEGSNPEQSYFLLQKIRNK